MNQVLLVGSDSFFQSSELEVFDTLRVQTEAEAFELISKIDFKAIIAANGQKLLSEVRAQGKHTPFLNLTAMNVQSDCCGGHMNPEATSTEKAEVLAGLLGRNHTTDCR